jgi:NADH dehydrogenase
VRAAFPESAILRPSIVFGPEDEFFNRFAGMARLSPALPLIGGGHTKFQPVFVGDVAEAIARSIEQMEFTGQTFELGGPNIYSFKEIMQFVLRETDRKRLLLPVPFSLATLMFGVLQFLPGSPFSADQVRMLRTDNVVSPGALTFEGLGIVPTSVEAEVPAYLWRFRPKGQYEAVVEERVEKASMDPA